MLGSFPRRRCLLLCGTVAFAAPFLGSTYEVDVIEPIDYDSCPSSIPRERRATQLLQVSASKDQIPPPGTDTATLKVLEHSSDKASVIKHVQTSPSMWPLANVLALVEVESGKGWVRSHKVVFVAFHATMFLLAICCFFSRREPDHSDAGTSSVAAAHLAMQDAPENTSGSAEEEEEGPVIDAMTYRTDMLTGLSVFMHYPCTVWDNETLWLMMRRLIALAILIAITEFLFVPDPAALEPKRFASVGTILNVFVGLLLSFFLASSVSKWYSCVEGFLHLFDSVRNLQMQFHALGVRRERADCCVRYGVVSAWLLNYELRRNASPKEEHSTLRIMMWDELVSREDYLSRVLPEERVQLEGVDDCSALIWTWVGSFIGRMAQDGDIPPMASPTYGRIVDLAQRAQDGLRQVKSSINVQMPFVYVHTLATIVQLNNILAAVSFGLTLGATMGSSVARINKRLGFYSEEALSPIVRPLMEDIQDVVTQLFKCFVVPVLYQAFFEIGVSISSPFSSEDGAIPTERLLVQLRRDLHGANYMAENPPHWKVPCFTAPVPMPRTAPSTAQATVSKGKK